MMSAADYALNRSLEVDGYAIVPLVLAPQQIAELSDQLALWMASLPAAGIRNLCQKVPAIAELARSLRIRALVEPVLGDGARLVRSVLFNKTPEINWTVAWHQDLAIPVRARAEVPGFEAWTLKDGVPHVQPPLEVLERMLTVRLHLDAADEANGALWVVAGSHRLGRLAASEAGAVAERMGKRLCPVQAGDVLLFRPLLLHASMKAKVHASRRIIHLEFSATDLPHPLVWATP